MREYPEYKASGVDWLGDIPSDWEIIKLKYLAKICNGQDQKDVLDENGKYPVYGSGGIFGYANQYLFEAPSVLLGRKGTVDKPILVLTPFWSVDTAYYTKISKKVTPFLFYHLCSQINFDYYIYGSTIPSMTQRDLNEIKFPISSISEQKTIVNFLDYKTGLIDKFIANRQKQIELLKEQKSAIINKAVTKGINPHAKMKASGIEWIREIPEDWQKFRLKNIAKRITNGFVGSTHDILKESGVRYIQALHVKQNTIIFNSPYYVSEEWSKKHPRSILKEGDIVITQTGAMTGDVGLITKEFEGCNCHALIIIKPDMKKVIPEYLLNILASNFGNGLLESIRTGSMHPHLNSTIVCNIYLPIPADLKEQQAILDFIKCETTTIETLISKYQKQIELMQEYKTALISQAVTGKIDVRNWRLKK